MLMLILILILMLMLKLTDKGRLYSICLHPAVLLHLQKNLPNDQSRLHLLNLLPKKGMY